MAIEPPSASAIVQEGREHIVQRLRDPLIALRNWLGQQFTKFLWVVFGAFAVPALVQFIQDGIQGVWDLSGLMLVMRWWLLCTAAITLVWMLARHLGNLDLYFYYKIWVLRLAPFVLGRRLPHGLADMRASYDPRTRRHALVRREHLMRKHFWPEWVFSIVTIFGANKIVQEVRQVDGHKKWILHVDLRRESLGIYSRAGKNFLRAEYGSSARSAVTMKQAHRFQELTRSTAQPGQELVWGDVGEQIPLRWASGGFLPLVRYEGRYWAMLFLRDIFPVGLNLANGASETKSEYKDLHHLIAREFSEETVVLSGRPHRGAKLFQRTFETVSLGPGPHDVSPMAQYLNPRFAERQAELRHAHDDIRITISRKYTREIRCVRTDFEVCVTYHEPDLKASDTKCIRHVLPSLNPAEFGIETIWLCTFELHPGEYILDGEYDISRDILIRRPVILLDLEFLRGIYERDGSLGVTSSGKDSPDCKLLPPVSPEHCRVFDADVPLRRQRLVYLNELLVDKQLSRRVRENAEYEKMRLDNWFDRFGHGVGEIAEQGLADEDLRTLLPVVWKTLELIFDHDIDYKHA